jgi:hypothetical protein
VKLRYPAVALLIVAILALTGCNDEKKPTADDVQTRQQETLLQEGNAQIGMPAIKNFRERKMLKDILELRDQADFVTYTYLENEYPHIVHGKTALAGKLTFFGQSIGYAIPYATQFTAPQKPDLHSGEYNGGNIVLPQADPNGLFSPASAEGTWIMLKDPNGTEVKPVYVEPRVVTTPFKLVSD